MSSIDRSAAELEDYRAIAPLAPLALLLGLASPVALIHPLLWFVPALGIFFSVMGLRQIGRNSGLGGRLVALVALGLGCFSLALAPARYGTQQWMLEREARQLAVAWIELITSGHLKTAHQWTLAADERQPVAALEAYYQGNKTAADRLAFFLEEPLMVRFRSAAQQGDVRLAGSWGVTHHGGSVRVVHEFLVTACGTARSSATRVLTVLIRESERLTGSPVWRVLGLRDEKTLDE